MNAHIITNRTVSAGTLTRTAALGLALTNQLLSAGRGLYRRWGIAPRPEERYLFVR